MSEVWFRDPHSYIRELAEQDASNILWWYGPMHKRRINPLVHAEMYFAGRPWRVITLGQQGAAEYNQDCDDIKEPLAVYPVFTYGEDIEILEDICQRNIGDDPKYTEDKNLTYDTRPIAGQKHKIFMLEIPNLSTNIGRAYIRKLKEINEDYPGVEFHISGTVSFKTMFGMGFASGDFNPFPQARGGHIVLPQGRAIRWERAKANPHWSLMLGFKPIDLSIPRNRCMYNIRSAMWAAEHWHEQTKFDVRPGNPVDPAAIEHNAPVRKSHIIGHHPPKPGDKIACDSCSLIDNCTYYREGAVCSVPHSETSKLAKMFNTRDSESIITGLGKLLEVQVGRLEKGQAEEEFYGELSPEVSKIIQSLFSNGVKLAKLANPSLNSPSVAIGINTGGGAASIVAGANPKQLVASIVQGLTNQGIPLENITSEMIETVLQGASSKQNLTPNMQQAIEGTVVQYETGETV